MTDTSFLLTVTIRFGKAHLFNVLKQLNMRKEILKTKWTVQKRYDKL